MTAEEHRAAAIQMLATLLPSRTYDAAEIVDHIVGAAVRTQADLSEAERKVSVRGRLAEWLQPGRAVVLRNTTCELQSMADRTITIGCGSTPDEAIADALGKVGA